MADTYGVLAEDVAKEIPGIIREGFSQASKPTLDQVTGFISDADTIVTLHMQRATGVTPTVSDENARLARRYVVDFALARVMRVVYAANDPRDVAAAAAPYEAQAKEMLERIDAIEKSDTVASAVGWASVPSGTTCHTPSW